ncbi:MAG: helix-turn-helix domain-containing protein [Bacteriovoracaceae bacterium]
MSQFVKENLDQFLGVVRKYMEVRGKLNQKDLAELTEIGVSTMSRFLNRKTAELNAQLIAKIVAKLEIPLHEVIDFVYEDYADRFIRLVKFYREDGVEGLYRKDDELSPEEVDKLRGRQARQEQSEESQKPEGFDDEFADALGLGGTAKKAAQAQVNVGSKKSRITFEAEDESPHSFGSLKEKLQSLSPRQKAYMTDFLNLDMEGRDLIVDLGNSLFRYFRQKGMQQL